MQYADFALWQRHAFRETQDRDLTYWKKQLEGAPEELRLPIDRPRLAVQIFAPEIHQIVLPAEPVAALTHELAGPTQATLYMTLLAAISGVCSARYSGQDDILVGSPTANRRDRRLEDMIGIYVCQYCW